MSSIDFSPFLGVIAFSTRELIITAALLIFIIGLDDIIVDIIYFSRRLWRSLFIYSRHLRMPAEDFITTDNQGFIAIFIPAWDESSVISQMLKHSIATFDYKHYLIFVGVYPNDKATLQAVQSVQDERIIPVITSAAGPTTKADCLNSLWQALCRTEQARSINFKAVVLHDSEDVVHRLELKVFNYLIDRFDMVQLPVMPLVDKHSRWISGHYLDEFSESHGKDLIVREALGASVPSAGVGCAIRRDILATIASKRHGRAFDETSLTEDYELGLSIGSAGGRGIFVRTFTASGQPVTTREHFPATFHAAVRQKARWLTGITLYGWDRLGWEGGIAERWMRLRDRKAVISALTTLIGYVGVLGFITVTICQLLYPQLSVPPIVEPHSATSLLLTINAVMLAWRLLMRALFTGMTYGWREGCYAVPRAVVANIIAIAACLRAISNTVGRLSHTASGLPVWDKTSHRFPSSFPAE